MSRPIAISDSANFYVSAERIFDPTLKNVPIIVLSNNDGCAVARFDEAKSLGIKMGAPLQLIQDKITAHGVRVFSSNYTLYGDISRRVVEQMNLFLSRRYCLTSRSVHRALTSLSEKRCKI